jgi:metallophosphoesterase (TIGR00282 family)
MQESFSNNTMNILMIADIVGLSGFEVVRQHLPQLKQKYHIHLTVANGENAAHGKGLTPKNATAFFESGINVITSGNHIWNQKSILPVLDENPFILRPLNYPPGCPGQGSCELEVAPGLFAAVINLQGRSFMYPIDCPFRTAMNEIDRFNQKGIHIIVVDFHAEATAEKAAIGRYLDGKVSAVIGTHTHVQTADERILPGGTAFITDIGMSGPVDSVIGMDAESAKLRFLTQIPVPYRMSSSEASCCGVFLQIDRTTGKGLYIERFQLFQNSEKNHQNKMPLSNK